MTGYAIAAGIAGLVVLLIACVDREPQRIAATLALAMAGFWVSIASSLVGRSDLAKRGREKKSRAP